MTSPSKTVKLTQEQCAFVVEAARAQLHDLKTLSMYAKGSAVSPYKEGMIRSLNSLIKKIEEVK